MLAWRCPGATVCASAVTSQSRVWALSIPVSIRTVSVFWPRKAIAQAVILTELFQLPTSFPKHREPGILTQPVVRCARDGCEFCLCFCPSWGGEGVGVLPMAEPGQSQSHGDGGVRTLLVCSGHRQTLCGICSPVMAGHRSRCHFCPPKYLAQTWCCSKT